MNTRLYFLLIISFSFVFCLTSTVKAENVDFLAGNYANKSSSEKLAQEYWKWLVTQPSPQKVAVASEQNPNSCVLSFDSGNKTIFLYNSYAVDTKFKCTVDTTKSILVPLLVGEWDATVEEDSSKQISAEDQWQSAKDGDEDFKAWRVILDDKVLFQKMGNEEVNSQLKDKILIRNSSQFTIHYPLESNRYDMGIEDLKSDNNTWPAVVDGYYLHLKPLPAGHHNLTYMVVHEPVGVVEAGNVPKAITWTTTYEFTAK
jgi:hypothetical protein